jgi:hypothetical protein
MYHHVQVDDETLIPVLRDSALVASKSTPGGWHATRVGHCDCDGWTYRGTCRHERPLRRFLGVDEPVPSYAQWLEQRAHTKAS